MTMTCHVEIIGTEPATKITLLFFLKYSYSRGAWSKSNESGPFKGNAGSLQITVDIELWLCCKFPRYLLLSTFGLSDMLLYLKIISKRHFTYCYSKW